MSNESSLIRPVNNVGAYARVADLSAVQAVQAAQPMRPRFPVVDGNSPQTQASASFSADTGGTGQEGFTLLPSPSRSGLGGLLGAFTSFLARMLGQNDPVNASSTMSTDARINAVASYGKIQGQGQPMAYDPAISMPNFTPLASGKVIDLTV